MATKQKDPISGQYTTGHEWDGIQELNTPLPKWWVWVFFACIIWAVGYMVYYPSIPTLSGYFPGTSGDTNRGDLAKVLADVKKSRAVMDGKIEAASFDQIKQDPKLLQYAMVGGKVMFNENCAACHGAGGVGSDGYPSLADDEWIWGGTFEDIQQTITHGVRNANGNSRQSEMTAFGAEGILNKEQIVQVAEYVAGLAKGHPVDGPGKQIYADNCVACHAEDGSGQVALGAPALNNNLWLYKGKSVQEQVIAQVNKPKHGIMPDWSARLDPSTIKQIAVYVHSLGGGK